MGCTGSKQANEHVASPGDHESKKEEELEGKIEIVMKTKRRARNVFTDSVDIDYERFEKRVIAKPDAAKDLIRSSLAENFIFSSLSEEEKEDFVNAMEERDVRKGENIITQGDDGDFFYVVESGTFSFIVNGQNVGSAGSGKSFGELALLYNCPRQATVRCEANAVVWALDRTTFRVTLANSTAQQKTAIVKGLQRVQLLQTLTEEQLNKVADALEVVHYEPGQTIIKKGTEGNIFYMIQNGTVSVTEVGKNNEFADHELSDGDYFGERALLLNEPRAANITAVTHCKLMALERTEFDTLLGPLRQLLDYNLNMRVLQNIKLFEKLTSFEKAKIASAFTLVHFNQEDVIISEGEVGEEFYIVKAGGLSVLVNGEDGEDVEVATLSSGDYFGERALLNNEPRKATVVATEFVELFVLDRRRFTELLGPLQDIMDRETAARDEENERKMNDAQGIQLRESQISSAFANMRLEDLQEVALLGTGTFGKVRLMQDKTTKQVFALKALKKSEIVAHRQTQNVINEKNVMIDSNHPFILRLHRTFKDTYRLYMLLEFIQGGELFSVLHTAERDGVSNEDARFYGFGVMHALAYLHERNIAYRDLKPENCMVDSEGYPKLVDFGFAKVITNKSYTLCGTPEYLAPEIVLGRGHDKSVDYWAFGILLYEMIAGYSPFSDPQSMDQIVICRNIVNGRLLFPKNFNKECKELVKLLLVRDPTHRLGNLKGGAYEILEDAWFGPISKDAYFERQVTAPWRPPISDQFDTSNFDPYEEDFLYDDEGLQFVDTSDWDHEF